MRVHHLSPLLIAFGLAWASPSRADQGIDLRTFRPSTDRTGTLATEGVETPGPGNLQVGAWVSFATPLLKVTEADGRSVTVLKSQLVVDPTLALGVGRRGVFGVTVPMLVTQTGGASSLTDGRPVARQGIGDLTLTGKATVVQPDKDSLGGLGFALVARLQLPTGDRASFLSDDGLVTELRGLFSYDYVHTLLAAFTAGYRLREHQHTLADVTFGDSIPWGVTLGFRPRALGIDDKGHWTWMVEGHGELGAVPNKVLHDARVSPVLVGPSIRYQWGQDYAFFAGAETSLTEALGAPRLRAVLGLVYAPVVVDEDGDGVPDSIDECPGLPGDKYGPQPGCPTYESGPSKAPSASDELGPPPDTDADGIPDDKDKCPNEPETFDGIDDADGCPEAASKLPPDADRDGIADDVDKCPDQRENVNGYQDDDGCPEVDGDDDSFLDDVDQCPAQAETFNGYQDDDGCPDTAPKPLVLVTEGGKDAEGDPLLTLVRRIAFDGASPAKGAASELRALAAWLLTHPGYRLRVAIATEGKGKDAEALAAARSEAVAKALVVYAHTGGAGEAMVWSAKLAPKSSNLEIDVTKEVGLQEGSTTLPPDPPLGADQAAPSPKKDAAPAK